MGFFQRMHAHHHEEPTGHSHGPAHRAPFWVRHYDTITRLVTLGGTRTMHEQTLSLVPIAPDDTILDVGCGTGALLEAVERSLGPAGRAIGLDVEAGMIDQARRRAAERGSRTVFELASVAHVPQPDDSVDVAFNTLVYHHLDADERAAMCGELRRVLKPGGRLLIVDLNPSVRGILSSLPGHSQLARQDYVRDVVVADMRAAGFSDIESGAHPNTQLSYAIGRA